MREALLYLTSDIDDVDYCVEDNDHGIEENDDHIYRNTDYIEGVNDEIDRQRYRTGYVQRSCRKTQSWLDENADFLVLYCQQFAFA